MSLILDALNRSSQDAGQIPGLATVHYQNQPESDARAKRRQLLLGAALVIALSAVTWLLLDRKQEPVASSSAAQSPARESRPDRIQPTAPQAAPVPAVAAVSPAAVPAPKIVLPPNSTGAIAASPRQSRPAGSPTGEEAATTAAQQSSVAELYRQQRLAGTQPAPVEPVKRPALTAAEATGNAKAKARAKGGVSNPAVQREEKAVDIEQMVLLAEEGLKNNRLVENANPFLATLSQQTKDKIPTLLYSSHDYSGGPGQSSVVLNGKTLKAGASITRVKVEEILPDSVVLSYQGTRFRLRALNSWVNL
jgi:hypothetical protein